MKSVFISSGIQIKIWLKNPVFCVNYRRYDKSYKMITIFLNSALFGNKSCAIMRILTGKVCTYLFCIQADKLSAKLIRGG